MSEFCLRKLRTHFRILDIDKDGTLTKKDFLLLGDLFIENEKPDLQRQKKIRDSMEKLWKSFVKSFGSDENIVLTEQEYIESMKTQFNTPQFQETIKEVFHSFFEVMDTNGDGFVQEDEYKRTWKSFGICDFDESARASFQAFDTNGDGKLSLEEICDAASDFFSSEDENSLSKLLLGPLI